MSTSHFQGFVHSLKVFMRLAQDEIDRGEKSGARVLAIEETRMNNALMFSKASDEWETPWAFYDVLDREFHFVTDAAATRANCIVNGDYFGPDHPDREYRNALTVPDWVAYGPLWLNPPYSKCREFIAKASAEARLGATVVCLVPSRTDTRWWHDCVWDRATNTARPGVEIRFIKGRLRFGGAAAGALFPSVVIIFDGRRTGREGTAG